MALDRLYGTYQDEYLVVQNLLSQLVKIKTIHTATNESLRQIIDNVRECLNQLGHYVDTTNWDPLIVYLVLKRIDGRTYDQWQGQRSLAQGERRVKAPRLASAGEAAAANETVIGLVEQQTAIPTWKELESFLENRARDLLQAAQREYEAPPVKSNTQVRKPHFDTSRTSQRPVNEQPRQ